MSAFLATMYEGSFTFPNGYSIVYVIEDGEITKMIVDKEANSVIANVETDVDYEVLIISIPRNILDSKTNPGIDNVFFVLVDGEEIEHTEYRVESPEFRTIVIPISTTGNTIEIEIFGTVTYAGSSQPNKIQRDMPLSSPSTQSTQITLDISNRETKTGQIVVFSGILTSNGQPVPHAEIEIRDEDFADFDDTLTSATTDSNGRFSIPWIVQDVDSKDRQTSARLLEFSTQMHGISFSNSILNMLEADTVEAYAEFKGSDMYAGSKSCTQNMSYGITSHSCQNNIIVITDSADNAEKVIVNSLLGKMIQSNDPAGQSSAMFSLMYDGAHSQSSIDSLNDLIVTEFFSKAGTSKQIPKLVSNLPIWYEKGEISRAEMINIVEFMMSR